MNKDRIYIWQYLFLSLFLVVGIHGCKLESELYNVINPQIFPKTEADAESLVTGNAYGAFQNNGYGGMFNIARGILLVSDLMSDYGECSWRQWDVILYNRWEKDNGYVNSLYSHSSWMGKITKNIRRIEKMSISEEKKAQYIAELKCAKGWLAFCMYDLFGPMVIAEEETLDKPLEEQILSRLSEEEMKTLIETNLKEAAQVLPYSYPKSSEDYGRFTKGLANMVLLKFYMQTKEWTKAVEIGKELTDPKYGYALVPEYKDIFTLANEKNEETIWAVNCKRGTQEHKWHPHVLPNDYPSNPPHVVKWNGFKISWPFMHTFEKGDKRLETIVSRYVGTTGEVHSEENDTKATSGKLYYGAVPYKYEIDPNTTGQDSEVDWIIYRYADAITLYAEAIVRKEGRVTPEALKYLNMVRTRAGLKAFALSEIPSARDFLDKLLLERAHELYFEGCRRQDLIRDDSYVDAIRKKAELAGEKTLVNKNFYRLPLPQGIINEGKGKIEQNPGY